LLRPVSPPSSNREQSMLRGHDNSVGLFMGRRL
jgi:hypothetical protein